MITAPTPTEALNFGWSIFPLDERKHPLLKKWRYLQKRQPTLREIQQWEQNEWDNGRQLYGWALVTGAISQRICFDFDGEKGRTLMRELSLSPHRRSPSDGYHVDFTHPGFRIKTLNGKKNPELRRRWPGLDPRGDGGYVMFSGQAIIKGSNPPQLGEYLWLRDPAEPPCSFAILPAELQEFLRAEEPRETEPESETNDRVAIAMLVRMALARVAEGIGRNNCGAWLAEQLRDNGYSKAEAFTVDYVERCPPTNPQGDKEPYTQVEWRATVRSIYTRKARQPWGPQGTPAEDPAIRTSKFRLTGKRIAGGDFDFTVNPLAGRGDGWFPRGDISLIAASSGVGKTTWMFEVLERQQLGLPIYEHSTNQLPYLVLLEDRSERSLTRSLQRMQINKNTLPYARLGEGSLATAVQRELLKCPVMPAVVFIEGIDLLGDAKEGHKVSQELKLLQQVAEHYHIALIGSTGSPKQRPKDHYISLRDQVIGSTVWARKTETIVILQREHGKETDDITIATVLARNSRPEQFYLVFEPDTGRLRALTEEEYVARQNQQEFKELLAWIFQRESFTQGEVRRAFPKMSGLTLAKRLETLLSSKTILPDGKSGKSRRFIVPSVSSNQEFVQ
jgi:hypothetical protein